MLIMLAVKKILFTSEKENLIVHFAERSAPVYGMRMLYKMMELWM